MFSSIAGSPFLETIICLVLVYALLSLLVSTCTEIVNSYFNERGRLLYRTISRLFEDGYNPNFGQLMYSHPMITALRKDINSLPQYISNQMFSQVLIDVIGNYAREYKFDGSNNAIILQPELSDPFTRFQIGVNKMGHTDIKVLLLDLVEKSVSLAGNDLSKRLSNLDSLLQQWYSDQMDRTTGWFKDLVSGRIRIVALIVALLLNVNSIYVFKALYSNPQLRNAIEPVAEQLAANYKSQLNDTTLSEYQKELRAVSMTQFQKATKDSNLGHLDTLIIALRKIDSLLGAQDSIRIIAFKHTDELLNNLAGLGIPIGWHSSIPPLNWGSKQALNEDKTRIVEKPKNKLAVFGQVFWWLVGIAITTFSISVGAPFWFDLLLKLVNMRKAGLKPSN